MYDSLLQCIRDFFFFSAYVSSNSSFPDPLSPEEEKQYIERYAAGDEEAREKLIEHNLRLVAHIAKKYASSSRDNDDLISIGTIGLIKAVSTFNMEKGTGLATYAARCIENEILMSIRAEKKQVGEVSINESIGVDRDGNEISLFEILGSDSQLVSNQVELHMDAEQLRQLIADLLTERERTVIELRYGLCGGWCMAQREVANLLGISRSYISRIEKKALIKLNKAFQK